MENNAYKEKLAEYLLQIKAIQLNTQQPFTWTSGIKSPVYCDNRKLLSYPEVRTYVKNGLISLLKEYFPQTECIAGVATAGIPHGAIIADALDLPFVYVRSKPKEHGLTNTIEGDLKHGQRVLVVEDTISTGGSSLKAVEDLRAVGAEVSGMIAIYKYGFESAKQKFDDAGVVLKTLTSYDFLIRVAIENGYVSAEELETLNSWRQNPSAWLTVQS
ncbi:MAG TPA: orotate phosphoribosyltransferase [Chitinophagales bacterium]|nr:orotate phosphoribosyltransferase [Chitinophagales bacterium]HNB50202.1 orotate phosphoribosyltransferase [Chitinophagales bacterium]HNF19332.1 orotate phosphoribosyltransferase [Chitinophagales bacterium]HNF50294.1 orotate phosphoribosyltransferase [Chitinophagales bacterium]HNG71905.1 orotate phosphoribosyltransferase [Chitinophagales bacterium]